MQEKEVRDIETGDMDIIENVIVAFRELWKKKLLIMLVTLAGMLFAILFINIKGNSVRYYSSATLYSAVYGGSKDTSEGVAVMNRYSDMIGSSRVCGRAAKSLVKYGITTEDLQRMVSYGMISVSGASTNSMSYGYQLTLSVFSDSSEQVLAITNAMSSAFSAELNELIGSSAIQVMDEATSYSAFNTLNETLYFIIISGGAFVAICGIIFVMAFFSPKARSVAQCEQDEELILGLLPYAKSM